MGMHSMHIPRTRRGGVMSQRRGIRPSHSRREFPSLDSNIPRTQRGGIISQRRGACVEFAQATRDGNCLRSAAKFPRTQRGGIIPQRRGIRPSHSRREFPSLDSNIPVYTYSTWWYRYHLAAKGDSPKPLATGMPFDTRMPRTLA